MAIQTIDSTQNPRVKKIVKLRQKRPRLAEGVVLVEGAFEIQRFLAAGKQMLDCYVTASAWERDESLKESMRDAQIFMLSEAAFDKVSMRDGPDGWLAVFSAWACELADVELSEIPLLIVAESVEKPGNLGALLRTADAVGVDALIVCDPLLDTFNPNVVRASRGLLANVPIALCGNEELKSFLDERGIRALVTTPHTDCSLWGCDLKEPIAIVVGSEADGVSDFWMESAAEKVVIPMGGQGDSLNVSVSAAVVLYEALRQRQ